MKIIVRLAFYVMICFMNIPVNALTTFEESEAMSAFEQDPIAMHAIKHKKHFRRIRFINNIKQAADIFKTYDSLSFVDPICAVNGKILHPDDVCDLDIENDHCVVTIQLRPGFAQFAACLGDNLWGNLMRCLERYILRSRTFTFVCDLSDSDTVDIAVLFFQAYSQTEIGNFNIRLRSPFGIEITLPSPIKY